MYLFLLHEATFFALLLKIDEEVATSVRCSGCLHCGGALHRAAYPRKPRGGPPSSAGATAAEKEAAEQLLEQYDRRFSLCCGVDGCRRRATPPSVRFLGRRVYLGAVVVLLSAMLNGVTPWRVAALQQHLPVSRRTLERWRAWWRTTFADTAFWRTVRVLWVPPVDEHHLPESLLERFAGDEAARLVSCLRLLQPLTTRSCALPMMAGTPAW